MQFNYRRWYWQLWWRSALVGLGALIVGGALVVLLAYFQGSNSTADTATVGQVLDAIAVGLGVLANYIVVSVGAIKLVRREFPLQYRLFGLWFVGLSAVMFVIELVYAISPLSLIDSFIPPAIALIALRISAGPILPVATDDRLEEIDDEEVEVAVPKVKKSPAKSKKKAAVKAAKK